MLKEFGDIAVRLSRSPLGIIALSFVLVYGVAGLVSTSSILKESERSILILFLVIFPVIILAMFYRLVTAHTNKLYAPSDFVDEKNFMKLMESRLERVENLMLKLENAVDKVVESSMAEYELAKAKIKREMYEMSHSESGHKKT